MVIERRPKHSRQHDKPDLIEAAGAVSQKILLVAYDASRVLTEQGIAHALIGGVAVSAYGAPRATRDVDFLVREKDAFSVGAFLSFKPGVPIAMRDVSIDYLTPEGDPAHRALMEEAIDSAVKSEGVPVVSLEALIVMKLRARRTRDAMDVRALLERHDRYLRVRRYLEKHAPDFVAWLEEVRAGDR